MGSYKIGSECCNNCIHWDAERDDKHGKENVFSYKNCAKCTSSHSPRKGLNTLSSNVCPYFSHIWGITKTFEVQESNSSTSSNPLSGMIAGLDEPSRAFMQAILDYRMESDSLSQATKIVSEPEPEEEEEDLDGEAEYEFADAMKELGRANERTVELVNEGMDRKHMFTEKAVEFMHLLDRAKAGNPKAQFAFAKALWDGTHGAMGAKAFRDVEREKQFLPEKWCRKAAEQGLAEAQFMMGWRGCCGNGESIEWLSRAAKQGHVEAEKELASLRAKLEGKSIEFLIKCIDVVDDDVDEAISCIKSATDELEQEFGETIPLYKLDEGFVDKFVGCLEQVAENGSPELQNFIGKMYAAYSSCRYIVAQDDKKAVAWFERAAKRGCSDAMDNLGVCYANGDGVDQDDKMAVQWYQKAAEAGLDWGQYHLAIKFLNGEGVDKNILLARSWLQKAADQGLKKAQERLASIGDECAAEENPASALRAGWKLYSNRNYEDAVRLLSMAEKAGLTEAKYVLGWCHYFGKGVTKDKEKAIGLFKSAAMKWFVSTVSDYKKMDGYYNNYGTSCRQVAEDFERKDDAKNAAKWFRFAARSGSYDAAKSLGYNYWRGSSGFDVDLQKAVYWFQIADWLDANEGDGYLDDYLEEAKKQLGEDCEDLEELEDWNVLIDGAVGDSESQYQIGCWMFNGEQGFCVDVCAAMAWWYRAAMQGHVTAQLRIAHMFRVGCDDVEKDEKSAFEWYLKAAEKGIPEAQNWVGRYHEEGWGCPKNEAKGLEWYLKAAEQGYAVAQQNAATCYLNGEGCEEDDAEAFRWYLKSAEQGRAPAQNMVGRCYQLGWGCEKDAAKAVEWYCKAVEGGETAAMNNLAFCYENAVGVNKDLDKALEWFRNAAEDGYGRSMYHLGRLYENGIGVDVDKGKAKEWYQKAADNGDDDAKDALERLG